MRQRSIIDRDLVIAWSYPARKMERYYGDLSSVTRYMGYLTHGNRKPA